MAPTPPLDGAPDLHSVDKLIVANRAGMLSKYGAGGLAAIDAALARHVRADLARQLTTHIADISDPAEMATFHGSAVLGTKDDRGAKLAVDTICNALRPDYVMLLDGPDVVPHVILDPIPSMTDQDVTTESDLPYACAPPAAATEPFFSRSAKDYLQVTRVVGRLPAARRETDANVLIRLLDAASTHKPQAWTPAPGYFAISAETWRISSQLNLDQLFGNHDSLHLSPDAGHTTIDASLSALFHFINCHGGSADWRFYGQRDRRLPVAMHSDQLAPHVGHGAVVAAECCFGAHLYDPSLMGNPQPICMNYLSHGAIGFAGSTNIAYGPVDANGQADLMIQYFLEAAKSGASTGRAMLVARQRFVRNQVMATPTNLKTLAQFVLYGDPSLSALESAPSIAAAGLGDAIITAQDMETSRKSRRRTMVSNGIAFAEAATFIADEVGINGNRDVVNRISAYARTRGYSHEPRVFTIDGGAAFQAASKDLDQPPQIAVIVEETPRAGGDKMERDLHLYRVFVAHILGGGITAIEECESR